MDRIGIIRLSSLGDIILSEPVSSNLKEFYPGSEIIFFTRKIYKPIAEMFPSVDRIECFEIPGADEKLGAFKVRLKEFNQSYDLVVDIHKNIRSRMILRHLSSTRKLTYRKDRLARQMAVWFKNKKSGIYTTDKYLEPLRRIGISINQRKPKLDISSKIKAVADEYISQIGFEKKNFMVLAVGASFPPKHYPYDQFAKMAEMIISNYGLKILVVEEREISGLRFFEKLKSGRYLEFGIGLGLHKLAGIISMARMTISNDSGVMHLSAATGTSTAGLFGPTHPVLGFAPMGDNCLAISTEESCSPCSLHGKKQCSKDKQYCFTNLKPELIIEKIDQYLR